MVKRQVQIFIRDTWVDTEFNKVRAGDKYRLIQNGEIFKDVDGHNEWIAACDAFQNSDGVWTITY